MAKRFEIRQSMGTRLFGLCYSSVLGGVAVSRLLDDPSWVPIPLIAFVATFAYRMWRFGVVADGGRLVVRNTFLTRHYARRDIAGLRLDDLRFTLPNRQGIRLVLRNGPIRTLGVTKGFRGQPDREPDLAALRSWLGNGHAA